MPVEFGKCLSEKNGGGLFLRLNIKVIVFAFLTFCFISLPVYANPVERRNFKDKSFRQSQVQILSEKSREARQRARGWALKHKVPMHREVAGRFLSLVDVNDNRPIYYTTYNNNASISTAAKLVRQSWPYLADGDGFTVGVWDAGSALSSHRELTGRVFLKDQVSSNWHSTHVAGTIAATGIDYAAKGMSPAVDVDCYDWFDDTSEMAEAAASYPGEPGKIYISNHSYGYLTGWSWVDDSGTTGWHWSGSWNGSDSHEKSFGQYDSDARSCDLIAYNGPYYLIFKAAGNDRDDNPSAGNTVYYSVNGGIDWNSIAFSTSTCPDGDGEVKNGYDTISDMGIAKNVMTVGAVNDAVTSGVRNPSNGTMSSFSGWGPTDDGRIKPDIVANGTYLRSCSNGSNFDYRSASGTSMATPNASGSAILLVDFYDQMFPGQAMRSSTLKGLLIHTADDLGNAGPDYQFGWGLMNTKAAADVILEQSNCSCSEYLMVEELLDSGEDRSFGFYLPGQQDVKVTICWTDPAANKTTVHDNSFPRLKNDLDLRIISSDGTEVYYPYVLDPANPSNEATTGDNVLDNVEQVFVAAMEPGVYSIEISHKGSLTYGEQYFSLISSVRFGPQFSGQDFIDITNNWLTSEAASDLNCDGIVNAIDFAIISNYWLSGYLL